MARIVKTPEAWGHESSWDSYRVSTSKEDDLDLSGFLAKEGKGRKSKKSPRPGPISRKILAPAPAPKAVRIDSLGEDLL